MSYTIATTHTILLVGLTTCHGKGLGQRVTARPHTILIVDLRMVWHGMVWYGIMWRAGWKAPSATHQ